MITSIVDFWNLNLPHRLHYEDSKSKLDVKLGETLMIEVTYELLKNNHGKHCRQYGNDDVNFDSCMTYINVHMYSDRLMDLI